MTIAEVPPRGRQTRQTVTQVENFLHEEENSAQRVTPRKQKEESSTFPKGRRADSPRQSGTGVTSSRKCRQDRPPGFLVFLGELLLLCLG
jgi:hypothetical protein